MALPGGIIRLNSTYYRAAYGWQDLFGIPGARRTWRSLFTDSSNVAGAPNIQKLRNEDMRWALDSFAGGEGQKVFRQSDEAGASRFYRSKGIDLSVPGEMRLQKGLYQRGYTGSAVTTVEGNTFADVSGVSTASGTDRLMAQASNTIQTTLTPAAGLYQARWYAFLNTPQTWEGSTLGTEGSAHFVVVGTDQQILWNGNTGTIHKNQRDPPYNNVEVTFYIQGVNNSALKGVTTTVNLTVRRHSDEALMAQQQVVLSELGGDFDNVRSFKLTFTAASTTEYDYRVHLGDAITNDIGVSVDKIEERPKPSVKQNVDCIVHNNTTATEVLRITVDIATIETAGTQIASASFRADGASTYSIRFASPSSGNDRQIKADKIDYQLTALNTPWNMDLGQGGRVWLVDYISTAPSTAFYWDAVNQKWQSAASFGPNGSHAVAMDATDSYEYILLEDKRVYQLTTGAQVPYTQAMTPAAAGVAAAANRLYVIGEDATNGGHLYEFALDETAGLPLAVGAAKYDFSTKGVAGDTTLPRRMAPMANGVVFFSNLSLHCVVHTYDAGASKGVPFITLPDGFQGRAIAHSGGVSWVAGHFPAVDQTGTNKPRPALFRIDHLSTDTGIFSQVDLKLWRDTDTDGVVQDIQLYGTDLFILIQVNDSPKKMRLWRVSLRDPGGAFMEQEVTTDSSQSSGAARAFALTYLTTAIAWGSGNPYLAGTDYITSGEAYLESSVFDFGLREDKRLLALSIDADIPASTSVEVQAQVDQDGTYKTLANVTVPGKVFLGSAGTSTLFRNLQIRVLPRSSLVTATPVVRSVETQADLAQYDRTWDMVLLCTDDTASDHLPGEQRTGAERAADLFAMANSEELVEFEDFNSSKHPEDSVIYLVSIETPDQIFVGPGESLTRVRFTERA